MVVSTNHNTVRNLLLAVLLIATLLGITYKYFEFQTVKSLANLLSDTETQEAKLVEKGSKIGHEAGNQLIDAATKSADPKINIETKIKELKKAEGQTNLLVDFQKNYLKIIAENRRKFVQLKRAGSFLLGEQGNFVREIFVNKEKYYEKEIVFNEDQITIGDVVGGMITVWSDFASMEEFSSKADYGDIKVTYPKYFSELAPLAKYSHDTFSFRNQESIKRLYPQSYNYLTKSAKYMGSFYSLVKDFSAGDYESAGYKYSRFKDNKIDFNPDYKKLLDRVNDEDLSWKKEIAGAIIKEVELIKRFKETGKGNYPLLGNISGWKEDLLLCQLYAYKSGLYKRITNEYPKTENFDDLLVELTKVSPETGFIDGKFDRGTLVKFTNTDKLTKFECRDKQEDKTYVFELDK